MTVKAIFCPVGSIILNSSVIIYPDDIYPKKRIIPIVKNVSGTLSFSIFVILRLITAFLKNELLLLATSGNRKNNL